MDGLDANQSFFHFESLNGNMYTSCLVVDQTLTKTTRRNDKFADHSKEIRRNTQVSLLEILFYL